MDGTTTTTGHSFKFVARLFIWHEFRLCKKNLSPFSPQYVSQNNNAATKNTAMFAKPKVTLDPAWYADSGASCHLTPQSSFKEKLFVGDGTSLDIKIIGSSKLYICSTSSTLSLNKYYIFLKFLEIY